MQITASRLYCFSASFHFQGSIRTAALWNCLFHVSGDYEENVLLPWGLTQPFFPSILTDIFPPDVLHYMSSSLSFIFLQPFFNILSKMHALFSMLQSEDRPGVNHLTLQENKFSLLYNYQICFYRELFSTHRLQHSLTLCHSINIQRSPNQDFL